MKPIVKCEAAEFPDDGGFYDETDFKSRCMDKMRAIPGLGILMALLSGICFATAGFTVELMQGHGEDGSRGTVDASLVVVIRGLIQNAVYLPLGLWLGDPIFGVAGERSYLIQRSFWGFICFTASYYSLSYVSLSDASAIAFSAPVFVSIFACVLLKEPCGAFQISTVIGTLVGVFLIARPSFIFGSEAGDRVFSVSDRIIGTSLSFVAALTMAYTFVVMRRLQKTPTTTVINFFSLFTIVAGSLVVVILKYATSYPVRLPAQKDIIFLFINGMCGVVGQGFLVAALKIEQAGLVSLTRTFDIVMAFIYQVACLNQDAELMSIIGAIIVTAGCVACGLKKFFDAKPNACKGFGIPFTRSKKRYIVNEVSVISCDDVSKK